MDEILKELFHLSNKPLVNLINGIFNTNYPPDSCIEHVENEFVKTSPGFKYAKVIADCILSVKLNELKEEFHFEFQLKNDKAMALRMFEYAFLKAAANAYSTNKTDEIKFPNQTVIFIEEDNNIQDQLRLVLEIKGNNSEYNIPVFKIWEQDISTLISKKLFPLLVLIPFSFRKEMESFNRKLNRIQIGEKALELMQTYHEISALFSSLYKDNELTLNDLEIVYNALNHIIKHIFNKFDVADIINKEVEKMVSTFLNPEILHQNRLETIRDGIIYNLKHRAFDFNEEELRQKLNNISSDERLFALQMVAMEINDIKNFCDRL
jgi:hypothetical protein